MRTLHYLFAAILSLLYTACTVPDNGDNKEATFLRVTPTEIIFDANGENSFTVETDGDWVIITSGKITLSTICGRGGTHTVYIEEMSAAETQTLIVRSPTNANVTQTVTITPSGAGDGGGDGGDDDGGDDDIPTGVTLYYDNFDGDPTYNNWANQGTAWQNPTGEGAGNVTYNASYAKIKNDKYGSAGKYNDASGSCYVNISKPGTNPSYLEVCNIATNREKKFTLSFGAIFKPEHCALYIKADDSEWKRLEYSAATTYNSWVVAKASFSLTNSAEMLSFRFEPISADATYGCNLDDLRLETSEGGQTVDVGASKAFSWAELPQKKVSESDYVYHTHWSNSVKTNKRVRNYSYCYDVRRHSPMWVAHPQHAIYQEGGKTRPASEPWACDPYLTDSQSAIIYPLYGANNCSLRTYFDSYYQDFYQWQRGHMLASSYRGCGDANNPAEINKQTFYSSNIAAQCSEPNGAFQLLWGAAERKILDSYVCSNTLYVVSGAHFANENTKATDANIFYIPDYCKTCIVPTHFYKIVLRTKSGKTGKAIQECSADELKAVGFWFSNTDVDEQTGSATPTLSKSHMRSVVEIEKLTGNEFDFFPDIPKEVKQSYTASEWGF